VDKVRLRRRAHHHRGGGFVGVRAGNGVSRELTDVRLGSAALADAGFLDQVDEFGTRRAGAGIGPPFSVGGHGHPGQTKNHRVGPRSLQKPLAGRGSRRVAR